MDQKALTGGTEFLSKVIVCGSFASGSGILKTVVLPLAGSSQPIVAFLLPENHGLPLGSTHDDQIAFAHKGAGYNLCLNNLELLATTDKPREHLEATFEPPESPL